MRDAVVIVAGLFLVAWWLEAYGLSRAFHAESAIESLKRII